MIEWVERHEDFFSPVMTALFRRGRAQVGNENRLKQSNVKPFYSYSLHTLVPPLISP